MSYLCLTQYNYNVITRLIVNAISRNLYETKKQLKFGTDLLNRQTISKFVVSEIQKQLKVGTDMFNHQTISKFDVPEMFRDENVITP